MPIGQLRTEADLDAFMRDRLDNLAIPQSIQTLKSAGSGFRAGTATVHWATATLSDTLQVPHGLPAIPAVVVTTPAYAPGAHVQVYYAYGFTDTEFTLRGSSTASLADDLAVSWVAVLPRG